MKITWFGASSPALVNLLPTADTAKVVYTFTSTVPIPPTAKGVILGVEAGYSGGTSGAAAVQCNIEYVSGPGPYWTDIARVTSVSLPGGVGASMQQVFVPFDTPPYQQFRYWLVSTDSAAVNKQLIIMLHGYWE